MFWGDERARLRLRRDSPPPPFLSSVDVRRLLAPSALHSIPLPTHVTALEGHWPTDEARKDTISV